MNKQLKERIAKEWGMLDPVDPLRDLLSDVFDALEQKPVALRWQQAPIRTAWGDDMVVANVAIDNDHTLSLYCERDQTPKVDAMFAQPGQTPVAWEQFYPDIGKPQLKQKPVAFISPGGHIHYDPYLDSIPLYTTPPKRPWVGLTDEEAQQAFKRNNCDISKDLAGILARAIRAKLKEKNNQ